MNKINICERILIEFIPMRLFTMYCRNTDHLTINTFYAYKSDKTFKKKVNFYTASPV
jgi:hypothetical protein